MNSIYTIEIHYIYSAAFRFLDTIVRNLFKIYSGARLFIKMVKSV
jgi:hypothetical protein